MVGLGVLDPERGQQGRERDFMPTHLPVPDVSGQHLVLLILWEDENSVRTGALTLWNMGRAGWEGVACQALRTRGMGAGDSPH